jgi:hypothetical protein
MNKTIRSLSTAVAAAAACLAIAAVAAAQPDRNAAAAAVSPEPDLTETDMSHTGSSPEGTVTVPWTMLGGAVGSKTLNGLRVGLYVLQAQEPEKLKPGDPNHAFTVTLKDDKSGTLLKQGDVSIAVSGGGNAFQRGSMAAQSSGVFRLGVNLPKPGEYRIKIAFKAAGHGGQTEFPYVFRAGTPAMPAHHH